MPESSNNVDDVLFSIEEIECAVNSLKQSQSGYCNNLIRNILYSHHAIYVILKMLFNKMLRYISIVSNSFGHSIITLVIKNRDKSCDANNYRPIDIISILCKIFEACVLKHIDLLLNNHSNQFGFVQAGGCN